MVFTAGVLGRMGMRTLAWVNAQPQLLESKFGHRHPLTRLLFTRNTNLLLLICIIFMFGTRPVCRYISLLLQRTFRAATFVILKISLAVSIRIFAPAAHPKSLRNEVDYKLIKK